MIRLLILAVGVFLLWVLFASDFTKQRKTIIVIAAMLLSVLILWVESNWQEPKRNLIEANQIASCGVEAKHSYRSNFEISICLNNTSAAHLKRLGFYLIASQCQDGKCVEIERVQRDLQVSLEPNATTTVQQNLAFDSVNSADNSIQWTVEPYSVRATAK